MRKAWKKNMEVGRLGVEVKVGEAEEAWRERKGDLKTIEFRGALAVRGASVFAIVSENHNSGTMASIECKSCHGNDNSNSMSIIDSTTDLHANLCLAAVFETEKSTPRPCNLRKTPYCNTRMHVHGS
jgi:hypothetical protein